VSLFEFDEAKDLSLMPMAARRALDWAGRRLPLAGWQGLSGEARQTLVRLGAAPQVDVARVLEVIAPVAGTVEVMAPPRDPAANTPPNEIIAAYASFGPILESTWRGLSPLARYALAKVAVKKRPERLRAVYQELIEPTRDSTLVTPYAVSPHLSEQGGVRMVDVASKPITHRSALAETTVTLTAQTFQRLVARDVPKGDVLGIAQTAGIMAAKKTSDLIPLCHPLALTRVEVTLTPVPPNQVHITARVEAHERTGVEMEAMTAVSVAALTLYDMLKALDKGITFGPTQLVAKSGGKSGDFRR
jgi:cyclic pyranopterin phosphate synthase